MPTLSEAARGFTSCDPQRFRHWTTTLGDRDLESIRRKDILAELDSLTCGPASRNRYKSYLSAFYRWCIERELCGSNPCSGIRNKKEPPPRQGWLDAEQLQLLLTECRRSRCTWLEPLVMLGASTGLRKAELLRLDASDVEAGALVVRISKNGSSRRVPLSPMAQAALDMLPKEGKLFPKFPRSAYNQAVKRCGFKVYICFHSLRHTAATQLSLAGLDVSSMQAVFGWKTPAMALRYSKASEKRAAVVMETVFR